MDAKGNTSLIQRNRRKNIYIGSNDQALIKDFHVFFASRSSLFKGFLWAEEGLSLIHYNRIVFLQTHAILLQRDSRGEYCTFAIEADGGIIFHNNERKKYFANNERMLVLYTFLQR